jgi:protocatechuate 3,4-dioxygenase beta subunit
MPYIHFRVQALGHYSFNTQMYVAGEPGNENNFILNGLGAP